MELTKKFTDALGRVWIVNLTWTCAQRIKAEAGIALDDLIPKTGKDSPMHPLHELITDGMKLFDLLWAIFRPECEQKGISKDQFGDGFSGDTFTEAAHAFMGGLHDFFPKTNPLRRTIVKQMLAKGNEAMQIAAQRMEKELSALDMNKVMDDAVSRSGSITTPVSLESTPAPSP